MQALEDIAASNYNLSQTMSYCYLDSSSLDYKRLSGGFIWGVLLLYELQG